jgi:hypothetical protein
VNTTINKIQNKIPFGTYLNEPIVNIKGKEVKQSGEVWLRAVQNFLNPSNVKADITDDIDKEIMRIFEKTGETYSIPRTVPTSVTLNGEKYEFTASEKTAYAKTLGSVSYNLLKEVFETDEYKGATDEIKAKMARDVYDYANTVAKDMYFDSKKTPYTDSMYAKIQNAQNIGMNTAEYLTIKQKLANIESSEDFGKKENFIAELVYGGYTDEQIKNYLIYVADYVFSEDDQKYIDILRSVK